MYYGYSMNKSVTFTFYIIYRLIFKDQYYRVVIFEETNTDR